MEDVVELSYTVEEPAVGDVMDCSTELDVLLESALVLEISKLVVDALEVVLCVADSAVDDSRLAVLLLA